MSQLNLVMTHVPLRGARFRALNQVNTRNVCTTTTPPAVGYATGLLVASAYCQAG